MPMIQPEEVSNGMECSGVMVMSARRKRIVSIFQSYYPEGGLGVVLMLAVIMVQVLVHGLVLGYGVMLPKIMRRFRVSVTKTRTKIYLSILMIWRYKFPLALMGVLAPNSGHKQPSQNVDMVEYCLI